MTESEYKRELEACYNQIEQLKEELHNEITRDYLTKIYNRRGLLEKCEYLIEVAKRDGSFLSVALIDIDNFDELSSQLGRPKGDEILQEFAEVLKHNTRKVDILGRFDGEKYMVIMPNTNKQDAIMVSERILNYVQVRSLSSIEGITISCGIATIRVNLSDPTLQYHNKLNLSADEALYNAIKMGRNRVLHYDDLSY
ncbi:MAG: GGDEF domain-containing protein [Campylobacterales bacterium]|nr:GGDEF domain-containing protein [Campylobacterales bacterium]